MLMFVILLVIYLMVRIIYLFKKNIMVTNTVFKQFLINNFSFLLSIGVIFKNFSYKKKIVKKLNEDFLSKFIFNI